MTEANELKLVMAVFCCTTTEVVFPAVAVIYGTPTLIPSPIDTPAPIDNAITYLSINQYMLNCQGL
jgi:hypothetical protein